MTIPEALDTLTAQLHHLGDTDTATVVVGLVVSYERGEVDQTGVLAHLDALLTGHPVLRR